MTLASVVANYTRLKVDALLAIDGIPILFGTRAGRTWDTSGTDPVSNHPSTWTSVEAIVPESIQIGAREMDKDASMVRPSTVTLSIASSSAWDKYFERRRSPQGVYLTTDMTATVTSAAVNSTSAFTAGDYAYIGRETIKITTIASGTSISVLARNQIAIGPTQAAYHRQTNAGSKMTLTPQYHLGRPAVLRMVVGDSDADFTDIITLTMADSPRYNKNTLSWELSFSDGMAQFDRKVAVGWEGAPVSAVRFSTDTNYVEFDLASNWDEFRVGATFGGTDDVGHLYVTPPEGSDVPPCLASIAVPAASGLQTVSISYEWMTNIASSGVDVSTAGITFNALNAYNGGYARRCYVFQRYPILAALKIMTSMQGNGDNGTYDVMYGKTSDGNTDPIVSGEIEKRFGAGIYNGIIDTASFEAIMNDPVDGWFYVLGLRGEEDLLSILEECMWAAGAYLYFNSSGKLAVARHSAAYVGQANSYTITDSDTVRDQQYVSADDEKSVAHTLAIECNVPIDGSEPTCKVQAVYDEYRETYRNVAAATVTVTRKGLVAKAPTQEFVTWVGDAMPEMIAQAQLQNPLHRQMIQRNRLTRTYSLVLPWKYVTILPGDRVSLTHSLLNSFDGSTPSSLVCEVIGTQIDYNGQTVTVNLRETLNGKWINPVGRLSGAAAVNTITLSTSSGVWGGGTTPARYWAAGWAVSVLDASASYASLGTTTISSISSDTQIILTAAPAGTAAGDLLVMRDYDNSSNTTTSAALGAAQRDHLFLADDSYTLGSSGADAHRWG